ncbi:MAG TPA: carbon storage regulator CsrA [Anaerolineales bacterium]|nr:carbon storage regulator CsrA [Anaerolineales bacterium]
MLILSRKTNESLIIRDDIVITVLDVEGDKVKLGINAPREIQVLREELWEAMQPSAEGAEAAAGKTKRR